MMTYKTIPCFCYPPSLILPSKGHIANVDILTP